LIDANLFILFKQNGSIFPFALHLLPPDAKHCPTLQRVSILNFQKIIGSS